MFLLCVFLVILIPFECATEPDPCLTGVSKILLDDGGRSSNCNLQYGQCDAYIQEGWYQVITEQDGHLSMPTTCVDMFNCGATYPVWLNGTLPTVSEGIVNRTACVSAPDNCCHHDYFIRVKNCGYYYVYYLTRCKGCRERYCFGDSNNCPTTTTSISTTKSPTTIKPTPTTSSTTTKSTLKDNWCTSSYVFMVLSACLLGTVVGLTVFILLRYKKDRRVEDLRRGNVCPDLRKTYLA